MNDNNRYTVVLHGLKAKDVKRVDELILEAIGQTLKAERFQDDAIDKYLQKAGTVTFNKTKNRSMVARLNKCCEVVQFESDELDTNLLINTKVAKFVSRLLVGGANEEMTQSPRRDV